MASSMKTPRGEGSGRSGSEPLVGAYFHWLVEQVRETDGPQRFTYWDLLRVFHETEFVWLVPNDDNRLADGLELRQHFMDDHRVRRSIDQSPAGPFGPCTMLEVLVALSRRVAWLEDDNAPRWAWLLLRNLKMHKFTDPLSRYKERKAEEILYGLVWRTYSPDGEGGFFPLAWPREDQTKVEIWYQMHAYVIEHNDPHPF